MRESGRSERVKQIQNAQRNLAGQPGSRGFPKVVPAASIRDLTVVIVVVRVILIDPIIFGDAAQIAGVCFKVLYRVGGGGGFIGVAVNPDGVNTDLAVHGNAKCPTVERSHRTVGSRVVKLSGDHSRSIDGDIWHFSVPPAAITS